MGAPTETYIDPAEGATNGNDHGGASFTDGSFANATNTLTKVGAFPAATCQAGDKIYLDDNGSGEVSAGLYTIQTRTDDDNVVLTADIRSGAPDPTDVRCDQHTGTSALPWATIQHALDFTTRDAANGDRFNIKAGTDDVLTAVLSLATYGAPTAAAPAIFQGYTATAGDGGIGGVDCGGANGMFGSQSDVQLHYLHVHNGGASTLAPLTDRAVVTHCEFDDTTGHGITVENAGYVAFCHFHNIGNIGVQARGRVFYCVFENGTNDFVDAIQTDSTGCDCIGNIITIDGTSNGIDINHGIQCWGNSIYSNGGTGHGIDIAAVTMSALLNNIIEGFSGVSGVGINTVAGTELYMYGHNAIYNCATNYNHAGATIVDLGNNETLGASPFTNPGAGNFEVDTSVRASAYPSTFSGIATDTFIDKGAAQREETDAAPGWW